jgi:nickel/cobalt transporter (NicO) family protein
MSTLRLFGLNTGPRALASQFLKRIGAMAAAVLVIMIVGAGSADAHPLGNFTTNTATQITVASKSVEVLYVVDMAEIPALKVRQSLNAATGVVPQSAATRWRESMCTSLAMSVRLEVDGSRIDLRSSKSTLAFPLGQAGLSTLRLECNFDALIQVADGESASFRIVDSNFSERLGWREITVVAPGAKAVATTVGTVNQQSPTNMLKSYPSGSASEPLRQLATEFDVRLGTDTVVAETAVDARGEASRGDASRGNDVLTARFQSLVAERNLSPSFGVAALALAVVLGSLHALAPGHGKTIMAAYAVTRRGRRGDIVSIGLTVALTHTVGITVLGTVISATSAITSEGALKWASVASGVLVVGVGVNLVRSRLNAMRSSSKERAHNHDHHDHQHDHHDHQHDHQHDHHDEQGDGRFITTTHSHGGKQHHHVLPAPGTEVRRRELLAMGLAGGMVPSPSALVVLLAAIALGRIAFGLALVVAYGVGLAVTLVAAGLLLVRFELSLRQWSSMRSSSTGAKLTRVLEVLPLVSGFAIVGGGVLLILRSVALH